MTKPLPSAFASAAAALGAWAVMRAIDRKRKTGVAVSLPFFVKHPGAQPGQFNEGWVNNPGILTEPVKLFPTTSNKRLSIAWGVTPGAYTNSHHAQSHVAALNLKGAFDLSKRVFVESGSYVGAVTGYDEKVTPALLFYAGIGVHVWKDLFIGVRLKWIPAKTLGGFSADSVSLAAKVGLRPKNP